MVMVCTCLIFLTGCSDYPTNPADYYKNKEIPQNSPPIIQEQPDASVNIGNTLKLRAVASDPDGDRITYGLVVYLDRKYDIYPNVEMDLRSGIFQFTARSADMPSRKFAFVARDDHGKTAETEFVVTVTDIEMGGRVEFYADDEMKRCAIVDNQPGIIYLHMFHNRISDVKTIQFYAPVPACWSGVTWLGDNIVRTHVGNTQDSRHGLAVHHDNCASSTVYLGYITFYSQGTGTECCSIDVLPAEDIEIQMIQAMDCENNILRAEGKGAIINGNETCPCDSQSQTTWQLIKVLLSYDDV